MRRDYADWLRSCGYDPGTITAQLHRCGRVEGFHGDLDALFSHDRLQSLLDLLRYSTEDERLGRANPTALPIRGVLRTNLASYRNAIALYRKFRQGAPSDPSSAATPSPPAAADASRAMAKPARRVSQPFGLPPPEHARTMQDFGFDGSAALRALLVSSRYGTLAQAVASLTVFSHPNTVRQTGGAGLFPTIRGTPGSFVQIDGRGLMMDDNRSPTAAFCWSNALGGRGRDVQFNHVYALSGDPGAYTALPNICMTPAFLAKATDTDSEVRELLAYRSFDLFGWVPSGRDTPARPEAYAALEWAAPLPEVDNVAGLLADTMRRKPKDRTVMAARKLGWLFGAAETPEL